MALNNRTSLGTVIAVAVVAALASFWLAVLVLLIAAFLIAWGQEPKGTEDFVGGLPGGAHLLKALSRLDAALASRGP